MNLSSPRQRCESSHGRLVLRLGEGKAHLGEGGLPRRGHVHLGKPKDREGRLSGPPRRGVARLGEGRLCLSEPANV